MSPWAAPMDCCAVFRDSASRTCAAISDCSALHRSRNSRFFRPVRRKETRARGWDREFESCFFLQRGCLSSEPPASTRRTPRFRGARRAHGDVRMGPTVRIRFPPAGSLRTFSSSTPPHFRLPIMSFFAGLATDLGGIQAQQRADCRTHPGLFRRLREEASV
jgi:hypothetical protein